MTAKQSHNENKIYPLFYSVPQEEKIFTIVSTENSHVYHECELVIPYFKYTSQQTMYFSFLPFAMFFNKYVSSYIRYAPDDEEYIDYIKYLLFKLTDLYYTVYTSKMAKQSITYNKIYIDQLKLAQLKYTCHIDNAFHSMICNMFDFFACNLNVGSLGYSTCKPKMITQGQQPAQQQKQQSQQQKKKQDDQKTSKNKKDSSGDGKKQQQSDKKAAEAQSAPQSGQQQAAQQGQQAAAATIQQTSTTTSGATSSTTMTTTVVKSYAEDTALGNYGAEDSSFPSDPNSTDGGLTAVAAGAASGGAAAAGGVGAVGSVGTVGTLGALGALGALGGLGLLGLLGLIPTTSGASSRVILSAGPSSTTSTTFTDIPGITTTGLAIGSILITFSGSFSLDASAGNYQIAIAYNEAAQTGSEVTVNNPNATNLLTSIVTQFTISIAASTDVISVQYRSSVAGMAIAMTNCSMIIIKTTPF